MPAPATPHAEDRPRGSTSDVVARQAALAEMAQHALSGSDIQSVLDEACRLVAQVTSSDMVDVLRLDADGSLTVVAGIGWRDGVVSALRVPSERGSQAGYTLASGEPVIVADFAAEARFAVSPVLVEHGAASGISVRIGAADRPYGALACFSRQRDAYRLEDAAFLESMANVLGSAVARLLVEAELRRSRDELATIVANVNEGISVQSAAGELLFVNDAAAHLVGYPDAESFLRAPRSEWLDRFELLEPSGQPMPVERLPGRVALVTGRPSPPTPVRFRIRATGEERWSIVQSTPVVDADGRASQVVNIFRDITDQHRAEVGQKLLADAAAVLSSTLDVDEAARRLAGLCVPELADYCVVDLLETGGELRSAAIAHADPARVASAVSLRERRPPRIDAPMGAGAVIRQGKSEMMADIPAAVIEASVADADDETRQIVRDLHIRSYICVPLMARARAVGALSLIHAESGRRFDEQDLRLAEEIGTRAGVAIENARLYAAVETRRAELDAVIAAMDEAVLFFDERGALRLSNRSATQLFGDILPSTARELAEVLVPAVVDDERPPAGRHADGLDALAGEMRLAASGRWLDVSVYRTNSPERTSRPAPG
jgi:GAF domain-containing protein